DWLLGVELYSEAHGIWLQSCTSNTHPHTHTHTQKHTYTHKHKHTHSSHPHTHINTQTHTHTHTHTHNTLKMLLYISYTFHYLFRGSLLHFDCNSAQIHFKFDHIMPQCD